MQKLLEAERQEVAALVPNTLAIPSVLDPTKVIGSQTLSAYLLHCTGALPMLRALTARALNSSTFRALSTSRVLSTSSCCSNHAFLVPFIDHDVGHFDIEGVQLITSARLSGEFRLR